MNLVDTFPKLLLERAQQQGQRPAMREKEFGIWQTWTWSQVAEEVRDFACGLKALGLERGQKLAIVGDNRPQMYWAMAACQCIGVIPVPTYQDSVAEEMQYVLDHAEVKFVVVEDQEQVDKILEIQEGLPSLRYIIYKDSRGMRHYDKQHLLEYKSVQEKGRILHQQQADFFLQTVAQGKGSDTAIYLYTSGTTGIPKGVVLSFDNVVKSARSGAEFEGLNQEDEVLAYLPMAWIGDHIFSYAQSYLTGFCVSCPESGATVLHDLREIGPTYFFAPPAIFENLLTTVMIRIEDAGWLKRQMFHYFMAVAKRVGTSILNGESVALAERLRYALGRVLVYGPLKDTLGLGCVRIAYTAGEAIGPEIFEFYRSLGINIKQLYGQTESTVFVTIQPDREVYDDTVGKPAPGVELKITDSGEVMYRSPGVFQKYYKNDEATRETKTEDGWVHTGDAGYVDNRGHLKIIDRTKDVGKLNDGSMFAPKYIENKLKFFPFIKEAVSFGNQRNHCTVMINIDLEAAGNWAERNNIPYSSYQELAANERVYGFIQENIEQVNQDLAMDEQLSSSQIRRFLILHKELDADDGELTRTRKVRRKHIAEIYGVLVTALYDESIDHCFIETEVTFEDGRTGKVSADLEIRQAKKFDAMKKAS